MTKEQQLEIARKMIAHLEIYNATGVSRMDIDAQSELKSLYTTINGYMQMDTGCLTCRVHYLNMIHSWYEREYALWLQQQPAVVEPAVNKRR